MKVKAFVYAKFEDIYDSGTGHFKKGFIFSAWPCKCDTWGVFVGEHEFDMPDVDENELRGGVVKLMKEKQQQIRAKCETEVQNIEQQIGELLAIEDKSHD